MIRSDNTRCRWGNQKFPMSLEESIASILPSETQILAPVVHLQLARTAEVKCTLIGEPRD